MIPKRTAPRETVSPRRWRPAVSWDSEATSTEDVLSHINGHGPPDPDALRSRPTTENSTRGAVGSWARFHRVAIRRAISSTTFQRSTRNCPVTQSHTGYSGPIRTPRSACWTILGSAEQPEATKVVQALAEWKVPTGHQATFARPECRVHFWASDQGLSRYMHFRAGRPALQSRVVIFLPPLTVCDLFRSWRCPTRRLQAACCGLEQSQVVSKERS